ncbi:MAG TPA: hypothetical protein VHE53_00050 [Patescibacteria group bacterium]|nr:hypothetical protein [Patescibacteria group bacterium]
MKKKLNKKYWFRGKRYGFGWYPITWQGWMVVILYVVFLCWRAISLGQSVTGSSFTHEYILELIPASIVLIVICLIKGEKPRWRWGN